MTKKPIYMKYVLTSVVVLIAALAATWKYWDYTVNPWTRDGQVRANVIQVAPRISGPIVKLPIRDNQFVRAGDLLFEIDPSTYKAAVDEANAKLDETRDTVENLEQQIKASEAAVERVKSGIPIAESMVSSAKATLVKNEKDSTRASTLSADGALSERDADQAKMAYEVAQADLAKAQSQLIQAGAMLLESQAELAKAKASLGTSGEYNAKLRAAKAELETAKLNLTFTEVRASVEGYVTNLNLRLGSQAVANQPALALVDVKSYWVHGYFRESKIGHVCPGDKAIVTLMTYPDYPLEGRVDSIGWGISSSDGTTGPDLLPTVSPTFQWIRLAQRVPVRVHLERVPEGVELRVGTTASVLVMTGTAGKRSKPVPPVPRPLQ
jgi:multidrug resistance efflux pump